MEVTEEKVKAVLDTVMDPELHMSIMDLGLVYGVKIENEVVQITMTLTTLGCPLFDVIDSDIRNKIGELGVQDQHIKIELTFDPPWNMDRMSERAKAMLGI
jgi:metal-sulfur cluster biosynthetic enzyme